MKNIKVLHITSHLGGGVGTVLSKISIARRKDRSCVEDVFLCLEPPEKEGTVSEMRMNGIDVHVCPEESHIKHLIDDADIVQLEWWHHPLLAAFMCNNTIKARLAVWSHTSGLSYPVIPREFVYTPHVFLFTSPVSHQDIERTADIDTVHSSGGFDGIPLIDRPVKKGNLSFSYLGAPNFSKLHPHIADFLNAVNIQNFQVNFFGDADANPKLRSPRFAGKIVLRGFTTTPVKVLAESDILIYLLNPDHYGTTENAILEAMAAGVVPVVLNNPVESYIVRHKATGMVVDSPEAFAGAISFLNNKRDILQKMSTEACEDIRARFPLEKTIMGLDTHYQRLMLKEKMVFNFSSVFGSTPHEWFLSCIGKYVRFFTSAQDITLRNARLQHPVLYERSKSSAFQFFKYFPQDKELERWVSMLQEDLSYEN